MKYLISCLTLLGLFSSTSGFSAVTPSKVLVLVEPSPLTYVSGYANRFQALFRHLDKRDSNFEVVTVDVHTPVKPKKVAGTHSPPHTRHDLAHVLGGVGSERGLQNANWTSHQSHAARYYSRIVSWIFDVSSTLLFQALSDSFGG